MTDSRTEIYLAAFRRFMDEGMTALEAYRQFDEAILREVMGSSLVEQGGRELLDLMAQAGAEESDEKDMEQAIELWMEGWTSEKPSQHCRVMSWYWRAPSKRAGRPGRKYLSTNQAWRAMRRGNPATTQG